MKTGDFDAVLNAIAERARESGVFGGVSRSTDRIECEVEGSAAPAAYRVEADSGELWVSLVTPDRWLSHSIEADLLNSGDKLEDLVEEELVELGQPAGRPRVEHFRSEEKLFTFRTPTGIRTGGGNVVEVGARFLLAYEACFRNLGDMSATEK